MQINLETNFESNHAGLTTLDPTVYFVRYRVKPDQTSQKHGDIISYLLGKADITVDSGSITTANAAFAKNVNFSIPTFDQTDYQDYIIYIQDILKSTFGYLTLGNDFQIQYKLFEAPSTSTIVNNIDILKNKFNIEVKYRDIVSQIIAFNPHYASGEATEDPNDSPSVTLLNNKTIYLHGIDKTTRFRHVLASINARLTPIINFRSERKASYILTTKISNIDSIIGDQFQLQNEDILGGDATKDLVILSLNKSTAETKIIATDLYNV